MSNTKSHFLNYPRRSTLKVHRLLNAFTTSYFICFHKLLIFSHRIFMNTDTQHVTSNIEMGLLITSILIISFECKI
nr:MAG TPA: hypothetical protein [Caudoviricetes sp.]